MTKRKPITRKHRLTTVLAECNAFRVSRGAKPVRRMRKGVAFDGCRCPVAMTIGHGAFMSCGYGVGFPPAGESYPRWLAIADLKKVCTRNAILQQFAADFDCGKYPELVSI